jgi:sortase A
VRKGRRALRALVALLSLASIGGGLSILGYLWWYKHHSEVVGHRLSLTEKLLIEKAEAGKGAPSCGPVSGPGGLRILGLLSIPAIGLANAPVVEGTGDQQLDVAVGHDPYSVQPGQPGTAVLSAHNITWFSRLPSLEPGQVVTYETPCKRLDFTVTSTRIGRAGDAPPQSADATLLLDTCWPIDALYLTDQRFEVFASLTRVSPITGPLNLSLRSHVELVVPAPPTLASAAQLNFPYLPFALGRLAIQGHPDPGWLQSTGPQDVEAAVLQAYQDAVVALQNNRPDWFKAVAPGVSYGEGFPLVNGSLKYLSALDPTITVDGTKLSGASLSARVRVTKSGAPGTYTLRVEETVRGKDLIVSSLSLTP